MTVERVVRLAEDDDLPEVSGVFHLSLSTETNLNDPFSEPAKSLVKQLSGTSSNFKRKVTNELKKYNRSADGTVDSKQITDIQTITGYDAFGVVQPTHNLWALADVYEISAANYAAVNAKVSNIVGLGFRLVETKKTTQAMDAIGDDEAKLKRVRTKLDAARDALYQKIEDFNEEDTFTETMTKVWRDYEVTGNGYIEVGRNADGTIGYVGHIPSQTIRIRRLRDGYVQIVAGKAQFFRNFGDKIPNPIGGDPNPNELIHIKKYSPTSSWYGVPDVVAAQAAIAGNEFATRFNLEYFENKAVPRHVITLKGAKLGAAAQQELLTFFETGLKGQNHRSLFIPLPADDGNNKVEFKIDAVEAGIQDSSFNNYRKANLAEILMAHRVPITKISVADSASLAIAADANKTFKEQVCAPEQKIFEKKLNRIVKEITDAFELKLNEMALTDANTQSQIDDRYIKNGTWTSNEVRIRDGMPAIEGGDERVNLMAPKPGTGTTPAAAIASDAASPRQRTNTRQGAATDNNAQGRNPKGAGRTPGTE